MLILLYLVFLCSNFLFIKSEDTAKMTIDIKAGHNNCTIDSDYAFTDGQTVNIHITADNHFNGWWTLINSTGTTELASGLMGKQIIHNASLVESMTGTWAFKFYYLHDVEVNYTTKLPRVIYKNHKYYVSVCRTNVIIAPKPTTTAAPTSESISDPYKKRFIIACSVGAVLVAIIIAQTAYIIFLKDKARKLITLNTHNNLSKKSESIPNDTARYCSNPGQKMMKVPDLVDDDNRDSVIYEAPNIEISENARMPIQPPQPPAITTMPRTPRPDHNMKIGPQAMLASAMSSGRSPMSDNFPSNFQRPKPDREVSVANRPPLPLPPHQGHPFPGHPHPGHPQLGHAHPGHHQPGHQHNDKFHEVYEEMETEENTYEPPPAINAMPPRLPMPPKKVPTGNLLDVKENTLKMRQGNKPLVTPKPQPARPNLMSSNEFDQALRRRNNDTMPKPNPGHMTPMQQELARRRPNDAQTNELEEALRRRNNVMQVPIVSIPDPSSRGSPHQKPPPALKSKPRGPPVPHPVQEDIYYNENQASSDEEWTYEPLKPLNNYDPNIYNV